MNNTQRGAAMWGVIVGIIILAIIIVIAVKYNRNEIGSDMNGDQSGVIDPNGGNPADQNGNGIPDSTEDRSTGSTNTAAPASISYQKALLDYADRRVQFNTGCQAIPNAATWKNGTSIMLDNRSPEARTLRLGSMGTVSVKAWGFKIVKLQSSVLPNAMAVDCGSLQNVAIITVQR